MCLEAFKQLEIDIRNEPPTVTFCTSDFFYTENELRLVIIQFFKTQYIFL